MRADAMSLRLKLAEAPDLWISTLPDYNCGCLKLTLSTSGRVLLCTRVQDKNRHE